MQAIRKTAKFVLITGNIIAVFLLILSCYGPSYTEGKYWILNLLNIPSFYYMLITLGFIAIWLFAKPALSLISISAFLICWTPLQNVFQWKLDNPFRMKKDSKDIRIMSWNIEHLRIREYRTQPELKQKMLKLIKDYNPDVACIQELVAGDSAKDAINDVYKIRKQLGYPYLYYSYDKKKDYDKKHHFGNAILSKLPLVNIKTFSPDPENYNSNFFYADVVSETDTIRFFNIHLQSFKLNKLDRNYIDNPSLDNEESIQESKSILKKFKKGYEWRRKQVVDIKKEMNQSPHPVILCGDFNDQPNSYAYTHLLEGLQDPYLVHGSGLGNTFTGLLPILRIDHIFTDKSIEATQFMRVDKRYCDHYPLIGDFRPNKKNRTER
jgi:endonuclease/exonuclease/phosphatase family metal-dependent hydrolase